MTALGAMLRQKRLDKKLGFRDAGKEAGIDPILFSQIEGGTHNAPFDDQEISLCRFLEIDAATYEGLARLHNEKAPELKAERAAHFQKVMEARGIIIATNKNSGEIVCPVCGKQLRFRVHSNGHVHAACETLGCLSWLE